MKCKEEIMSGFHFRKCSRKSVIDGYCRQHHPESVKKRRIESENKWMEKQENTPLAKARRRITELEQENARLRDEVERLKDVAVNERKMVLELEGRLDEDSTLGGDEMKESLYRFRCALEGMEQ